MKKKSEENGVSLTDIIETLEQHHEQSRESCIDDSGSVHSDSSHAGGASHHESTHSHPPYSSDIRKSKIEKEEEQSKPTVERGVSGKGTHSHSPYSSDIRKNEIDNDIEGINHTSTHHNITNHPLPPYSSEIQSRQVDILRLVASISCGISKQEEQRPWRTGNIYQQSDFRNDITTPEQLWERLRPSRKAANNLAQLYKACEVLEGYVADGIIEEVAIATTGVLAQVFSKSTASEVIKRAEQLDLLRCTDPHFCPSTPVAGSKRKNGTARKYIVNPRMVELVKRTYRAVSGRGRAVGTGKNGGVVAER